MFKNLKQKLSLMRRKTITKTIEGQEWTFSPVSLSLFYELKTSLEPMWLAIQALSRRDASTDGERTISTQKTKEMEETITHLAAPSIEMQKFRAERADQAVKTALTALLGRDSRIALARILGDSLRTQFENQEPSDEACLELFGELDLPTALEFVGAFIEVNASVFGPLVQRAFSALRTKMHGASVEETPSAAPASA